MGAAVGSRRVLIDAAPLRSLLPRFCSTLCPNALPWFSSTGRIAAGEGRFNQPTNSEVIINSEVKSIPVNKKGVYFAFRDQGACISLLAIKVGLA